MTELEMKLKVERSVIADVMVGGTTAYEIAHQMGIRDNSFTDQLCANMWRCFTDSVSDGCSTDLASIAVLLKKYGIKPLDAALFSNEVHTDWELRSHCNRLNAFRMEREMDDFCKRILTAVEDKDKEHIFAEMKDAWRDFEKNTQQSRLQHLSKCVESAGKELIKRKENFYSGELAGITTGLPQLNRRTNGWQKGTLNIVAARPGMGKTAFAIHFALEAAKRGNHVCVFEMEMRSERIADRLTLAVTDLDGDKYRRGEVTAADIDTFNAAGGSLSRLPIYIDDNSNCTVGYIHAAAKQMKEQGKCDLVIIDYLQLVDMSTGSARTYTRENMVTAASRAFKVLAKELDIPVILLSQLNRAAESRADKRPMLSDLRESGSIEQDADTVLLLHRPEYYNDEDGVVKNDFGDFMHGIGTLIIAKQREGGTGDMDFYYNRSLTQIWDGEGR